MGKKQEVNPVGKFFRKFHGIRVVSGNHIRVSKKKRSVWLPVCFPLTPILILCAFFITQSAQAAATDHYYLFEYTTNATSGLENQIEFFIITYNTSTGNTPELHSQFLFPTDGSLKEGYALVNTSAQTSRDNALKARYSGESPHTLTEERPFQAYKTAQYVFTSPHIIREVERIQILAGGDGSWECQGMRLFRVDELGEMRRYNTISQDTYIDFKGELIAQTPYTPLAWSTDKLITFSNQSSGKTFNSADYSLTTSFDKDYAKHEPQDNNKKTLAVRIDFADTCNSGLEYLSAPPNAYNQKDDRYKLNDNLYFLETMSMTLRYQNRYGNTCTTEVPFVTSAVEWARSMAGTSDVDLSGLAQQGESLTAGIFIPDFGSFDSQNNQLLFKLGAKTANEALGSSYSGYTSFETASSSDNAMFTAVALYDLRAAENDAVSVDVDSMAKTLRYEYKINPFACRVATSLNGESLKASEDNYITLGSGRPNAEMAVRDTTARYLVEIKTDNLPNSSTRSDTAMKLYYTDYNSIARNIEIDIREAARDFYGDWYGTPSPDFGYYQGVSQGSTLRFTFRAANIKEITDVTLGFKEKGTDDWQITDFSIFKLKSLSKRVISWEDVQPQDGISSDRKIDRVAQATLVYSKMGQTQNPTNPADPDNPTPTPSTPANPTPTGSPVLILPDEDGISVGPGTGGADVTKPATDWTKIRYSMTYQEASQDLGFTKRRCLYTVEVKVSDTDDSGGVNGDCGSKNLFYFRLIFRSGSSAFVLANQQLEADGFRTGKTERFYIGTNQDYGDVIAVQIFPEDVSEDSDKYDKLKIDEISVSRSVDSALVPTWTIHNVGWIDISFRDEGQLQSVTGQKGRSTEEMIRSYNVDTTSYRAKLLVAVTTGQYGEKEPQFEGSLSATLHYEDNTGQQKTVTVNNIVDNMYEYIHHQPKSSGGKSVSDTSLMFRANHTDRFIIEVDDVMMLYQLELFPRGEVSTIWNIDSVSVFLIRADGTLMINRNEEYERSYPTGQEPVFITSHDSELHPAYHQEISTTGAQTVTINFLPNPIDLSPESRQWQSVVSRKPVSENDTLNLFIYPDRSSMRVGGNYTPKVTISYTTAQMSQNDVDLSVENGDLNTALYRGETVYYASGINVSGMSSLDSITVYTGNGDNFSNISRAFVQRVRNGVVIDAWDMAGSGLSDYGITLGNRASNEKEEQRVMLQLGTDTQSTVLNPETYDIAVALWYRTDNPGNAELRSPYVYLTDQNYTSISPGQTLDLKFNQLNISEITGISLVSTVSVNTSVSSIYIADQVLDDSGQDGLGPQCRVETLLRDTRRTDVRRSVWNTIVNHDRRRRRKREWFRML